jgi:hypothetical protein
MRPARTGCRRTQMLSSRSSSRSWCFSSGPRARLPSRRCSTLAHGHQLRRQLHVHCDHLDQPSHLTRLIGGPSLRLVWINFIHLFLVSLLPFTTAWMAQTKLAPIPVVVYAPLLVCTDAAYNVFERHVLQQTAKISEQGRQVARRAMTAPGRCWTGWPPPRDDGCGKLRLGSLARWRLVSAGAGPSGPRGHIGRGPRWWGWVPGW